MLYFFSEQYMKALKATLTTSQPVISPDDFCTVFYRITELHAAHSEFLHGLKERTDQWDGTSSIGELFRVLVGVVNIIFFSIFWILSVFLVMIIMIIVVIVMIIIDNDNNNSK